MSESSQDENKKDPSSENELPDSDLDPVAGGIWGPGGCIPYPFPKGPFPRDPIPMPLPLDPFPPQPPEPY